MPMKTTKNFGIWLVGAWVILVALDGIMAVTRGWYTRRMNAPVTYVYRVFGVCKTITLFVLIVANMMFLLSRGNEKQVSD